MTLQEFITKYNGKGIDWDGHYGNQCTDLARFYWKEVTGLKTQPKGVIGAKDFWTAYESDTALNTNFHKIPNTPNGVPREGDIMIWGSQYGKFGHIAIVTKADVNSFTAFSQNDPTGSLSGSRKYSNYNGVLGWFSPKQTDQPTLQLRSTVIDFDDSEGKRKTVGWYVAEWHVEKQNAQVKGEELAEAVEEADKVRVESTNEIRILNEALRVKSARIKELESKPEGQKPTLQEAFKIILSHLRVKDS